MPQNISSATWKYRMSRYCAGGVDWTWCQTELVQLTRRANEHAGQGAIRTAEIIGTCSRFPVTMPSHDIPAMYKPSVMAYCGASSPLEARGQKGAEVDQRQEAVCSEVPLGEIEDAKPKGTGYVPGGELQHVDTKVYSVHDEEQARNLPKASETMRVRRYMT